MTTTNTTTAIALNDKLAPVFQKAFQDLLSQARIEPNFHSRLKEALKKFNLLSYRQFSPTRATRSPGRTWKVRCRTAQRSEPG